jgi:cytochrome b561
MDGKYNRIQVALHWVSAAIIIWGIISGFYVALFQAGALHKEWVSFLNVSLTTLFIPIFIFRVCWAWRSGKPHDSLLALNERRLSLLGHLLIYINITVVMITGVLMMERDINVFNVISFSQPLHDPVITSLFNKMHKFSCATLGLLVMGHVLAVVKHHHKGRNLLRRMSW